MDMTLGKRISTLRHEKGFKQDELAEKLNVSPQAVSKWENDQTCPDISLLPDLAQLLGVSIDELLCGKKENVPAVRLLPENERKDIKDMFLRIQINSEDGDKVKINLPCALLEVALASGMSMAQISGNSALQNIDLAQILDLVRQGAIGNLVDIESSDGETLKIFVE